MPNATRLRTPWASQAIGNPNPLPEYPRPMLERTEWRSLNGPWEYVVRPALGALVAETLPMVYQGQITVPFALETVASGVTRALGADETLFYRRTVEPPVAWRGRRVVLNFEAVDYECAVWVDGQCVGSHLGGYLPFSFDLPWESGPVEVVVGVRDPGPANGQQYGKQSDDPGGIWYTATSGIWQTVWAEPRPANAITAVHTLTLDRLDGMELRVETEQPCQVEVGVELPDGGTVRVAGNSGESLQVRLPDPRPWTLEDPYRYRLRVTAGHDEVWSWAGLRTVALGPIPGARRERRPAVLLNGQPVLLNAPLDQGYWPETGMTAPADEALVFDLQQLRDLGFNGVRKHIKVESRRFYDHADRLGMLVIQDVVNGGKPRLNVVQSRIAMTFNVQLDDTSRRAHRAAGRQHRENRELFEADMIGMIKLLDPHPSVVCWTIFNEAWGQYQTNRIESMVRIVDPTRLIDAVSGWYDQGGGDFRSRHRYILKLQPPPRRDRRPFLLSEFGGYNLVLPDHQWDVRGHYGYGTLPDRSGYDAALRDLYREQLIPLVSKGLRGCVYTQLSDVETETNGLFSYDRQVLKPDAWQLRSLNAELYAAFAALGRRRR
ncbi:MAG: glycoside hydrolase family 2 TIM barrel-domain containing protein [Brooklawnia sp.]|uniref:glycoside hydrolase family 2 protein n=1 Tax=Brooklawnia sp. TaxID=2699740 RepID=UPI003C7425F5